MSSGRTPKTLTYFIAALLLTLAVICAARDIEAYIHGVVYLTLIPVVAYPLLYMRMPWHRGRTGRALMNMACALALLYLTSVWGEWQPFNIYPYVQAVVVTYLGIAITYQLLVMIRVQCRGAARSKTEVRT